MKENPRFFTQARNFVFGGVKKMEELYSLNSTNDRNAYAKNQELHRELGPFYIIAQGLAGLRRMAVTGK